MRALEKLSPARCDYSQIIRNVATSNLQKWDTFNLQCKAYPYTEIRLL